jgi:hypothetical protein
MKYTLQILHYEAVDAWHQALTKQDLDSSMFSVLVVSATEQQYR